jgi:hypothetical protein
MGAQMDWITKVRTNVLTLACAGCALMIVPAVAGADTTISSSANSNVTVSGCSFTATAATSNVNVSAVNSCLQASTATTITDGSSGAGAIDVNASIAGSACSGSSLELHNSNGAVTLNSPVNIGSCNLEPVGDNADITQTTGAVITAGEVAPEIDGTTGNALLNLGDNSFGTFAANVPGTLTVADSTLMQTDAVESGSGGSLIDDPAGIEFLGVVAGPDSHYTLAASNGAVTEASPAASISVATVDVTSQSVRLNSSNTVILFSADATQGPLDFSNSTSLNLAGAQSAGDATITTGNSMVVSAAVQVGSNSTLSLTASSGGVTESSTGTITGGNLDVSAPGGAISLPEANAVSGVDVTAGNGAATISAGTTTPLSLLGLSATGAASLTDSQGPLSIAGPISGVSLSLTAPGFAGTSGGKLTSASISLADQTTGQTWQVGPSSIADGASAPISYTDTGTLSITGGDIFDVTPSAVTTFSLNGDSPAAGTLNLETQGDSVSGTTAPPSGTAQVAGFDPVEFTGMAAVNLVVPASTTAGGGTPATTGTTATTGTGTTGTGGASNGKTAVACSLRAATRRITIPSRVQAKHGAHPTLSLRVTCTSSAAASVSGRFKVTTKLSHTKTRTRSYAIAATHAQVSGGAVKTFLIRVPAAVVSAVNNERQRVAASFTLEAAGSGGTGHADLTLGRVL